MRHGVNEQFLKKLKNIHGDDYEPLEDYTYTKVPILVRHVLCGTEYKTTPDNLLRGAGCKLCGHIKTANARRKTLSQFKKEVYDMFGDDYEVLGDYVNCRTKILIKHNIEACNHTYEITPTGFLKGYGCSKCNKKNTKTYNQKSQEQVEREINDISNNEFVLISTYKNNSTNLKLKHNIGDCGYVFEKTFKNFSKYPICPKCEGRVRNRDTDMFKNEVEELVGDEYSVLGEYIDTKIHVTMQHNTCKTIYDVSPSAFLCGNRCPTCNNSRGEDAILKYLKEGNINHLPEYKIDDCRNERPLPFDFAIFDNNNTLKALIEFEGIQHFEAVEHFGGDEQLKYTQHNDNIKRQYCTDNNIKLLEIPYWELENVENILSEYITQL